MEYTELTPDEIEQINRQRLRNVQLEHYQHKINKEVALESTAMTEEQRAAAIKVAEDAMAILEEQAAVAYREIEKAAGENPK